MSATTIRELLVRIGVEGTDSSAKGVADLDASLTDLVDVFQKVALAVVAVTGAIAGVAISAANAGDSVDKGAQAAAISTDAYQELAFVAGQTGTSIETVTKALGKQTQGLAQLEAGAGPAGEAMAELGLTYEQLSAMSPDQQFAATSTAIAGVADEQERLRLATAIYGEEMAQQLMPMLSLGGAAMADLQAQAHELGLVMSEDQVAAAVLFTDSLDQLLSVLSGIKNAIGLALLPVLTDLITRVRDWYTANAQLVRQKIAAWADVIVASIESLVRWMELADEVVQRVFGGWEPILAGAAVLVAVVAAGVAALGALKAWVAIQGAIAAIGTIGIATFGQIIAIILGVAAAVVGLFLVIDDLVTYFRGGQSAIGDFINEFRTAEGYLGAAARTLELLIGIGVQLWGVISQLGAIWYAVFSVTTLPVLQALGGALLWLAEVGFGAVAWWANTVVIPALNLLLSLLQAVGSGLSAIGGVLGIEMGSTATAPSSTGAAATSAFAPEAIAGAAPAGATGAGSTSVQVQGSTLNVSGVGMTMEEVEALVQSMMDSQATQAAAALAGAPV